MKTKRYTSEQQILDAIDRCHVLAHEKLAEADRLEARAKECFKAAHLNGDTWNPDKIGMMITAGDEDLENSRKLRKAATSLLENKAWKLGEKLSELRTGAVVPLTGQLGLGDMSVEGV